MCRRLSYHTHFDAAVAAIVNAAQRLLTNRDDPLLIALDGGSGAGKSALASQVERELNSVGISAALIPSDDFYAAHIPDDVWESFTFAERADHAIDWCRLRAEALEPLVVGRPAKWYPFDFEAGPHKDGTYPVSSKIEVRMPAAVILLDGAYSTRPELADLIDISVLVDVPTEVRHARLSAREEAKWLADWHDRWDRAEAWYFRYVRPPDTFDLRVHND